MGSRKFDVLCFNDESDTLEMEGWRQDEIISHDLRQRSGFRISQE
jgi:hypothetical protein